MAFAGFVFIGVIFGFVLAGILGLFLVMRIGGPLKERLAGDLAGAAGRRGADARSGGAAPGQSELAQRVRSLQEEVKVTHRLMEQGRDALKARSEELARVAAELEAARGAVRERDEALARIRKSQEQERAEMDVLRSLLVEREASLMQTTLQLRDIETERGVAEAGADVFSDQVSRLEQERDELARRVAQLEGRAGPRRLAVDG